MQILFDEVLRERIMDAFRDLPKDQKRRALNKMEEAAKAGDDVIDLGIYTRDDPIFEAGVEGGIWMLEADKETMEMKVLWECETLKCIFQNEKMVNDLKADMGYSVG